MARRSFRYIHHRGLRECSKQTVSTAITTVQGAYIVLTESEGFQIESTAILRLAIDNRDIRREWNCTSAERGAETLGFALNSMFGYET